MGWDEHQDLLAQRRHIISVQMSKTDHPSLPNLSDISLVARERRRYVLPIPNATNLGPEIPNSTLYIWPSTILTAHPPSSPFPSQSDPPRPSSPPQPHSPSP